MKLLIVSTAPLINRDSDYAAYAPYVKELEIWERYADEIIFCCPIWTESKGLLSCKIPFKIARIFALRETNIKTFRNALFAIRYFFFNAITIYTAMKSVDHIHLRCPGNVGLMGCLVQMFFPGKPKTAKYAGNWDPNAVQPLSYKLQKWILNNTFLTRNMTVLVYGDWPGSSSNIKPFFTATYREADIVAVPVRHLEQPIKLLFIGTLSPGKQPLLAVQIAEELIRHKILVEIDFYGEGTEMEVLRKYIEARQLGEIITLHGNQPEAIVRQAYQDSHFLILPSKSEGWPKVVAEAMFWGCVPVATPVSCVSEMLGQGKRGIIMTGALNMDTDAIAETISDPEKYRKLAASGMLWARGYTLDYFEQEIKNLLIKPAKQ